MAREPIKVRLSSVFFIVVILFLLIVIGVMYVFYNPDILTNNGDGIKNETGKTNNKIEEETEKITEVNLSTIEKITINEKLSDEEVFEMFKGIIGVDLTTLKYDVNLMEDEENKFEIVLHSLYMDGLTKLHKEPTGAVSVSVENVNKYYNKIFGHDMNRETVNEVAANGIQDDMVWDLHPTMKEPSEFILKVNKLELNEKTNRYILTTDYLLDIKNIREEGKKELVKLESDSELIKPETFKWYEGLNYAKLKFEYEKDEAGNIRLISVKFVKNDNIDK